MSLVNRQKSEEIERRREVLLAKCMMTLASGLGVEITSERVILYKRPLSALSDEQLKRGFELALKEYKPYGGSFPSPGEIRDYAMKEVYGINDAPEVLKRGEKPPDWEPISPEELQQLRDKINQAAEEKAI